MNCRREDLLLYAVTDRAWLRGDTLYHQVEQALQGGATWIQLREKNLGAEEFLQEAKEIRRLCRSYRVPFVIDDDVRLALEVDADGVHVGQKDMEASEARAILGKDKIIGVSARTVEQAQMAQEQGADYLGVGAVFATGTKTDAVVIRHETVKEICEAVTIPVIAIGGISRENVMQLAGTGICGVAVVSAIFAAPDIRQAASELREVTAQMVSVRQQMHLKTAVTAEGAGRDI